MPKGINPIRKARLKAELLKGKSQAEALRQAGYSPETAHSRVGDLVSLKIVKQEIAYEINKKGLAEKAYKTLEDNLLAEKKSDRNTAAIALLDFTEGKKTENKNTNINTEQAKSLDNYYNTVFKRKSIAITN